VGTDELLLLAVVGVWTWELGRDTPLFFVVPKCEASVSENVLLGDAVIAWESLENMLLGDVGVVMYTWEPAE